MERREFKRLQKEYCLEYGLFSDLTDQNNFKKGFVRNLSGGGVLFVSETDFSVGTQLVLKITISGWKKAHDEIVKVPVDGTGLPINAIAEVLGVHAGEISNTYLIRAKFSGQVHT